MFKRYVFILAVVSAIGSASLEARERGQINAMPTLTDEPCRQS